MATKLPYVYQLRFEDSVTFDRSLSAVRQICDDYEAVQYSHRFEGRQQIWSIASANHIRPQELREMEILHDKLFTIMLSDVSKGATAND